MIFLSTCLESLCFQNSSSKQIHSFVFQNSRLQTQDCVIPSDRYWILLLTVWCWRAQFTVYMPWCHFSASWSIFTKQPRQHYDKLKHVDRHLLTSPVGKSLPYSQGPDRWQVQQAVCCGTDIAVLIFAWESVTVCCATLNWYQCLSLFICFYF